MLDELNGSIILFNFVLWLWLRFLSEVEELDREPGSDFSEGVSVPLDVLLEDVGNLVARSFVLLPIEDGFEAE